MQENQDKKKPGLEDESEFEASLDGGASGLGADKVPLQVPAAPQAAEKPPSWAGKVLGHFKLLRLIGQGNMGIVIQALDVNLERLVALKVLRKRIISPEDRNRVEQFFREARAAAKIDHPNVVKIYEINQHKGWWYIAMELLEGDSLKRIVEAAGSLSAQQACPLIADAAAALDVAHREGIIHRDIKPANLMITRAGRCKLTDFGLVRMGDENDPFEIARKTVGTPYFIAPEIIEGKIQTQAVDIYSLGCTLYFALTGKPPFQAETMPELFQKHIHQPPPDVRMHCPKCSPVLAKLIGRMLAKEPSQRPTAADVAAVLRTESISLYSSDTSLLSSTGTGILSQAIEKALDSMTEIPTPKLPPSTFLGRIKAAGWKKYLAVGVPVSLFVLLVLTQIFWAFPFRFHKTPSVKRLESRFPDRRSSYGILPAQSVPQLPQQLNQPPPFSWLGKIDTTGLTYASAKNGRYYYSLSDPMAILIRQEDFIGYQTAEQARADGKLPAHQNPVWMDTPIDSPIYP